MNTEKLNRILETATLLYDKQTITDALNTLAEKMSGDYATLNPVLMVVMNGGLIFAGKLLPRLHFPAQLDYCHATRYGDNTVGNNLIWKTKPQMDIHGRHVILLDDILDEGYTLQAIINECQSRRAASVKTAVMIEKCHNRKAVTAMKPDYCELQAPDRYIFGCGMDYGSYWRNIDNIYIAGDNE